MYKKTNQKGFTLIELLIVIVIIGILSGVLIAVIDPVRQQNRARNSSIQAALNKAAFAANTTRAGLGRLPYDIELMEEMENLTLDPGSTTECTGALTLDCIFNVAGTKLPDTCTADSYSGIGTTPCYFFIVSPKPEGSLFRVIGKAYKLNPGSEEGSAAGQEDSLIYVFDSSKGFYQCPASTASLGAVSGTFGFTVDVSTVAECVLVGEQ